MIITTNNHRREFLTRFDVPSEVLEGDYDYLDENDVDGFFRYCGQWYHVSEFLKTEEGGCLDRLNWHGYSGQAAFFGVVIRIHDDGESFTVGSFLA
tara:strand:+ start:716 stop:1003 length:288 start_codon:yes stop_codon:yes gene_type:complete